LASNQIYQEVNDALYVHKLTCQVKNGDFMNTTISSASLHQLQAAKP